MKGPFWIIFSLFGFFQSCKPETQEFNYDAPCPPPAEINEAHPLAPRLQALIDSFVAEGLPGATVAVLDSNGAWAGSSGHANLEEESLMQPCMVQHAYSVSKMIVAIACMRLYDKGLLDLDRPVAAFLPANVQKGLPATDRVTLRMLLNHSSGYREFHTSLKRLSDLLNRPTRPWSREDLLGYVEGKSLLFEPGSDWAYSNTNYLLLTYVLENITGKDHAQVIQDEVFSVLGLERSYYKIQPGYPDALPLPNHYWDRYANGVLENCSQTNLNIACHSGFGEDGVLASPLDLVRLMQALAQGELLSQDAWIEMTRWVQGSRSDEPDYGLGLVWVNFAGGAHEFGHYGGGIGGQCSLMYLPEQKMSVFTSTNVGREGGGHFAYLGSMLVNRVPERLAAIR